MSGYVGWLERENYRDLRQVEREVYPSIQEMLIERDRAIPPRKTLAGLSTDDLIDRFLIRLTLTHSTVKRRARRPTLAAKATSPDKE